MNSSPKWAQRAAAVWLSIVGLVLLVWAFWGLINSTEVRQFAGFMLLIFATLASIFILATDEDETIT